MKLKILGMAVLLGLLPASLSAKKALEFTCDNRSTCVNNASYYLEVKRVVRRGETIIIQVVYVARASRFSASYSKGFVELLDAQGNNFKIDGKEISSFSIAKGEKKVISFKFKGNKEKQINEPFDLTIKADRPHGEITLFDLKQESRFRKVSPTASTEGS